MQHIVIIGGGPAGLMAATQLRDLPVKVTIVDHKPAAGRKFLVAGDGGFNLTHSEPLPDFLQRYDREIARGWVERFTPEDFREWLRSIGVETIVGSSGKVFPLPGVKPIEVLNAWLKVLKGPSVDWRFRTKLIDFTGTQVKLQSKAGIEELPYDFLVFALGGASWKKTGSDGSWTGLFREKQIPLVPFQAGNSGLELPASPWLTASEGSIIKNIRLSAGEVTVAGDIVVTGYGIEGKPVYAVNRPLRASGFTGLRIDFRPQLSEEQVATVLTNAKNVRAACDRLKIPVVVYNWLKAMLSRDAFMDPAVLSQQIKGFQPEIKGLRPLDEVISTVGGVEVDALEADGRLKQFDRIYCAGEMIDWDAPTGGYLLQACVASGFAVGQAITEKLKM